MLVVVGTVRRCENPFAGLGYVLWYVHVLLTVCVIGTWMDSQVKRGDLVMCW